VNSAEFIPVKTRYALALSSRITGGDQAGDVALLAEMPRMVRKQGKSSSDVW
jgi:hypothetical protein